MPKVMKTKFPATVMVFGIVFSEEDVMPLHVFEMGLRVNRQVYLGVMETTVLPWIKEIARNRPWVWQQDSAPYHVSAVALKWIKTYCYNFVQDSWPPSGPDLNPFDYLCGAMLSHILTDLLIPPRPPSSPSRRTCLA